MLNNQLLDPRRILLFTADREVEAEVLSRVVARAQALNAEVKVQVALPIDALDQDVEEGLLRLESLKNLAERRRKQRMELLLTPYEPLLKGPIEIEVTSGIEFIELLRARVLENFARVFWVKTGVVHEIQADEDLFAVADSDDRELGAPQADLC